MDDWRPKNLILILAREFASKLAVPMLIVDDTDRVVFFNEAAEELLGTTFAEAAQLDYDGWLELNTVEQVVPNGLTVQQLDTQIRVGRAMRQLLPAQREVLRMHDLEGMNERDIAAELGKAKTPTHNQLHRARAALARAIERTWDEPYDLMEEVTGTAGPVTPAAADLLARLFGNNPEDYEQWSDLTGRKEA